MPKTPPPTDKLTKLLEEPLDSIMTFRLGASTRAALREIAGYYKTTEQDLVRRFAAILASTFQDAKSQAELGVSYDDLLSRTTRFTLVQFMDMSPEQLRRMADEFSKAANALAGVIEKEGQSQKKPK
jgi:hypothetical protein